MKQALFNRAVAGIASQGWTQSILDNDEDTCAYNGANGAHCAVGWLLNERGREQVREADGNGFDSVRDILQAGWIDGVEYSDDMENFLAAMQSAHDGVGPEYSGYGMKERLCIFARQRGLDLPEELA